MIPLADLFASIVRGMQHEVTIFGFTISMWGIMFFTAIADIIIYALRRIFYD